MIKRRPIRSFDKQKRGLLFMLFCIFFTLYLTSCDKQHRNPIQLKEKELNNIIVKSGNYFVKQTRADGMFVYRVNLRPIVKINPSYNFLRHAGTIYSIAMFYKLIPDEKTLSAIRRTGRFLRDKTIGPVESVDSVLAVWSDPKIIPDVNSVQAKLGGTGLGLVALLSIEEILPGFTPLPTLQSLGRFIVFMQKPNESFYSKYIASEGGRLEKWTSLYYPGEAALGLMMLYNKDNNEVWLKSAVKAMEYLAVSRKNDANVPPDHWALLATEQILNSEHTKTVVVSQKLLKTTLYKFVIYC